MTQAGWTTITVGPYTFTTSEKVAAEIAKDPAKLLEVYEMGNDLDRWLKGFGYGKEERPQA